LIRASLDLALANFALAKPGAFYGAAAGCSLGAGVIYGDAVFPLFDNASGAFDTVQGLVYVVTHECDVDQSNVRRFNEFVVVCPLIPLEDLVAEYESSIGESELKSLLVSAAKNDVFRVFFLPPTPSLLGVPALERGALMYLNQLCSTHVSFFIPGRATALCALSTHGLERLDWKFQNLLFRPKADDLPRVSP
jgi:hypothetical protein